METFLIILAILVLSFVGWYSLQVYRLHRQMSYTKLTERLRRNRQTYNRMTAAERNSRFGKALLKSITWCDDRLKEMERDTGSHRNNIWQPRLKDPSDV